MSDRRLRQACHIVNCFLGMQVRAPIEAGLCCLRIGHRSERRLRQACIHMCVTSVFICCRSERRLRQAWAVNGWQVRAPIEAGLSIALLRSMVCRSDRRSRQAHAVSCRTSVCCFWFAGQIADRGRLVLLLCSIERSASIVLMSHRSDRRSRQAFVVSCCTSAC